MRRPFGVVIDFVQGRLAAADVVGHVFRVGCATDAGRHVGARDLEADAMAGLEQIAGRQNLDLVFLDLAGLDPLLRGSIQRVPGPPRPARRTSVFQRCIS